MKQTITCGRCKAKIDVEEGLKIATCLSLVSKKFKSHTIEIDTKTDAGYLMVKHLERKPQPTYR